MEYKNIFEIEFIQRTQEIVNGYQIPFENTLFINACVGLLIISDTKPIQSSSDRGCFSGQMGNCRYRH